MKRKQRKFVLTVGDDGAILIYMEGSKVLRRLFASGPAAEDTRHFESLLKNDTHAPIAIFVDVMDQNFVQQTLPPVSALSVKKLIKRRLERDFSADDIKGALPLGRSAEGRKDWNYLFVSIANIPPLSLWVEFVISRPNEFRGLYLLPIEAAYFVRRLKKAGIPSQKIDLRTQIEGIKAQFSKKEKDASKVQRAERAKWDIFVSHNKVGGFRQVVLREGRLIFTRMAQPIGENKPEVIAGNIEQELGNTIEYIKRLGFNPMQGLEVMIIAADQIRQNISLQHQDVNTLRIFTPHEVASLLKLEKATEEADHFGDVVMAAAFGTTPKPRMRFTTKETEAYIQQYETQHLVKKAVQLGVPLAILASLYQLYIMYGVMGDRNFTEKSIENARERQRQLQTKIGTLPENIDHIADVVSLHQALTKENYTPTEMASLLSVLLDDTTLVQSLDWEMKDALPSGGEAASKRASAPRGRGTVKKEAPKVEASFAIEFSDNDGEVDTFLARVTGFNERLKKLFPDYVMEYSSLPGANKEAQELEVDFDSDAALATPKLETKDVIVTYTLQGPTVLNDPSETKTKGAR